MLDHLSQLDIDILKYTSFIAPIIVAILEAVFKPSKWIKKEVVQIVLFFLMFMISVLKRMHKNLPDHIDHLDAVKSELMTLKYKAKGHRVLG